jgi:hypothetical protein
MPRHLLLIPLLTLALVAGCGGPRTIERRLGDDTAAAVQALNAKDVPAARRALDALDADLSAADRLDQLDDDTIASLRAGVSRLRADLALLAPKPAPSPTPVHTTVRPREPEKKRHGKGDKGD